MHVGRRRFLGEIRWDIWNTGIEYVLEVEKRGDDAERAGRCASRD